MLELFLILMPVIMGGIILTLRRGQRQLLVTTAVLHLSAFLLLALYDDRWQIAWLGKWLAYDNNTGMMVLLICSFLFLVVSIHAFFWLPMAKKYESGHGKQMDEAVFCGLLCFFLATMTTVTLARNFGLLWVAVEATTLTSAPLICFHRSRGSLEAMWKYLLICSVGIGLALFGTFLLGVAARGTGGLDFAELYAIAGQMDYRWFKAAFVFCLVGYGLKMGLAPFHTWLPDAHSEAPSMVSVLLSGSLLNCSFLAIVRVMEVAPTELGVFCRELLIALGLLSLLTAAVFIIRQRDYKRMLAYSSVEHMGLLALMWGVGVRDLAVFHMLAHSLCKMTLFLIAGNILMAEGTRRIARVKGIFARGPLTATLWMIGIMMICAVPPSPLFVTEYALVSQAGPILGGVILVLLFVIFCGMTLTAMNMTMGENNAEDNPVWQKSERLSVIPTMLMVAIFCIGVYAIWVLCAQWETQL